MVGVDLAMGLERLDTNFHLNKLCKTVACVIKGTEMKIEELPTNPFDAAEFVSNQLLQSSRPYAINASSTLVESTLLRLTYLRVACERSEYGLLTEYASDAEASFGAGNRQEARQLVERLSEEVKRLKQERLEERLNEHFSGSQVVEPIFRLNRDEVDLIVSRCSEMKLIVSESNFFSNKHKARLLERISHVEKEVFKEKGRFDVILAAVVDIGDAAGQFGEKVEPLVKRIKEIRQIAQSKTNEYKGLPKPDEVKQLPPPEEEAEEE